MYKKNQIIRLKLTDLAEKNLCFGKLNDGISVFVQGMVAIDDVVDARIIKIKKNYLLCNLETIVSKSLSRINPKCKYFGLCGGCKWQHIDYNSQISLKRKQVQDSLIHIGRFNDFQSHKCIPADKIFYYRNKVDLSFTDLRYLSSNEILLNESDLEKPIDFALGFHPSGCYSKAIDIDYCYLVNDTINKIIQKIKFFCIEHSNILPIYSTKTHKGELRNLVIRHGLNTEEIMVNLITSTHNKKIMMKLASQLELEFKNLITTFVNSTTNAKNTVAFGQNEFCLIGKGFIYEKLNNYKFRISPNSFFQTNTHQAEKLFNELINLCEFKQNHIVYDLCCGTGVISILISKFCEKVLGIEINDQSIQDANINAEINNVKNCEFINLDIKNFNNLENFINSFGKPNTIIVDPPRAGLPQKTIETIIKLKPKKIIYISCNPSSFARDAKVICENFYELEVCKPIDLFPQTNHVETLSKFSIK